MMLQISPQAATADREYDIVDRGAVGGLPDFFEISEICSIMMNYRPGPV